MSAVKIALGLAGIALGVRQIKKGVESLAEARPTTPMRSTRASVATRDGHVLTPSGPLRLRTYAIRNLDDRIRKLRELVELGKRDPAVYEFARRAVTKKCGGQWCVNEKDTLGELRALFAAVRGNVRYTSDIRGIDSYQNPGKTLKLRGGDCLPEGTQLLRADGQLVGIESIAVGDVIFDGFGWTQVTNWWDKGEQDLRAIGLNNGCELRCTDGHKLFRVPRDGRKPGQASHAVEVEASKIELGDELLQPRELGFADPVELSAEEALILGAYVAEGSERRKRTDGSLATVAIAGIADSKGVREKVLKAALDLGFRVTEQHKEIYISDSGPRLNALLQHCGRPALNKRLPHVRWSEKTVRDILVGLNADGGVATNDVNFVFSTISPTLAVQYRMLQRVLGRSVSIKRVDDHGGFGSHPIYRVTVRASDNKRPWAKVRYLSEGGSAHVFDIETDSHRFYLPEQDVVVHNCDDYSTLSCAAAASIGIPCRFKVIRTKGSSDWNHIYAQMGLPRQRPVKWVSFDSSVDKPFGWEAPPSMVAASRTFRVA